MLRYLRQAYERFCEGWQLSLQVSYEFKAKANKRRAAMRKSLLQPVTASSADNQLTYRLVRALHQLAQKEIKGLERAVN